MLPFITSTRSARISSIVRVDAGITIGGSSTANSAFFFGAFFAFFASFSASFFSFRKSAAPASSLSLMDLPDFFFFVFILVSSSLILFLGLWLRRWHTRRPRNVCGGSLLALCKKAIQLGDRKQQMTC